MNRHQKLVLLLTLLGLALRLYHLTAVPYRGDEAHTVLNWVTPPLLETLNSDIPLRDPQPPLAFAVFWFWAFLVGMGEFSLRSLPALANVVGIPAMYALGRRIGSQTLGVLAALLWTIHPFLIWHAQDARPYALWSTLSVLSLWLGLRALEKQRPRDWLIYVIIATGAAYVYYLELFMLAAINLYVLVRCWRDWSTLRRWVTSQVMIGLLLAPWYLQPRLLFNDIYGGTTFPIELSRIWTWLIPSLNLGRTFPEGVMAALWPVLLIILLLGLIVRWRARYTLLLALTGFLPVLLLSLVSLRMNIFTPRYILSVVPIYVLLVAQLFLWLRAGRTWQRISSILLAGGWLFLLGWSLNNLYFNPAYAKAHDWPGLVAYLERYVTPNDLVVQTAADEAFTVYFDQMAESDRLPASPHQSISEIESRLQQGLERQRRIWLVANPAGDWPNRQVGQDWLDAHMQRVRQTNVGGLPVAQYLPWEIQPDEIPPSPLATFADVSHVAGVRIFEEPEPTGELAVWVYWQPIDTTNQPLKAFLHLVDSELRAQDDHLPQDGRISTQTWSTDTVYRDIYRIPIAGVPAGQYTLHLGLYDPETGTRVMTTTGQDHVNIGSVQLP
jgi:hypothetical protein